MLYLVWQDDSPKRDTARMIAAACERYEERFGTPANVALIPESAAMPSVPGVRVEALRRVAGNTVQVGCEE